MTILLFLFGVAVAAGFFFILADILKLPRLSTEKALLSAGRAEKKRMKSLDAIFLGWAMVRSFRLWILSAGAAHARTCP